MINTRRAHYEAACYSNRDFMVALKGSDIERFLARPNRPIVLVFGPDAGLAISPEARAALVPLLGGDRLASRHEIRKVALFARGKTRVDVEDVVAVVADASTLEIDGLVDAAFAGRTAELEIQFGKARTAGTAPGTILGAALRHVAQLHRARLSIDEGTSVGEAAAGIQPFVHFSRKPAVESALRIWTSARLQHAMAQLAEAALEARQQSAMAELIAQRALLTLAVDARRKETGRSS